MELTTEDFFFIGLFIECFLYGLYSGIFIMYFQDHWALKKGMNKTKNIIFYAVCALYALSVVIVVLDITFSIYGNPTALLHISFVQGILAGCCDFIAQSILIYRCWIVWGCNIRVVIVPSILAFLFLVMWLVNVNSLYILSDQLVEPRWGIWLGVAGVTMSMIVNALVTGLIVSKIFNVYREAKSTLDDQVLGVTGGSKIRTVIFILIESGMILFSIQLARVVFTFFDTMNAGENALLIIVFIHQMLNGITPTIILVRVSMGLSFHDKESMTESISTLGTLCFVAKNPNSILETGDVNTLNRDSDIGVRLRDDIQIVDR